MTLSSINVNLRQKIILPLSILLALLLGIAFFIFEHEQLKAWEAERSNLVSQLDRQFDSQIQSQVDLMSSAQEILVHNASLIQAFIDRDREQLYQLSHSLYQEINQSYHVTHFYFSDQDRVNFLRVHQPNRFGDTIRRISTLEAERSGKPAWGLEIGPLGTYTLRLVRPIYKEIHHGELLGYLELGMEIEHTLNLMSDNLGVQLAMLVEKDSIDRSVWERGMHRLSRAAEWDKFKRYVLVFSTDSNLLVELAEHFQQYHEGSDQLRGKSQLLHRHDDEVINFVRLPLGSEQQGYRGLLIAAKDVARSSQQLDDRLIFILQIGSVVTLLFLIFLYLFLGRLEHWYAAQQRRANKTIEEQVLALQQLEQEEKEALSRLKLTMDASLEGILLVNLDRELVDFNRRFAEIWGLQFEQLSLASDQEAIGLVLSKLKQPERFTEKIEQLYTDQHAVSDDELELLDGRIIARHTEPHIISNQVVGRIWNFLDVTKEYRGAKARDEFLAAMSHELRTPLTAIIGNVQLLQSTTFDKDTEQDLLQTIELAGKNQLTLVNDILDMSKIESGKFTIENAPYALSRLLDEIEALFRPREIEYGVKFTVLREYEPSNRLLGDQQRISQIITNLLSNAFKFTEQNGEIKLTVRRDQQELLFEVSDNGIGMSEEVVSRLFGRFEQADETTSARFGGSGLGLFISYNLATMMEGSITVQSEERVGSTFTLRLPYKRSNIQDDEAEKEREKKESSASLTRALSGHILVAEDTKILQILERRIIEKLGPTVSVANNGIEAVEQIESGHFDLVLMDMLMPEMDGLEATKLLRSRGYNLPIIALTANAMPKHRESFSAAGCNDFLAKPFEAIELEQLLRRYL